jgi:hypothetical protein
LGYGLPQLGQFRIELLHLVLHVVQAPLEAGRVLGAGRNGEAGGQERGEKAAGGRAAGSGR